MEGLKIEVRLRSVSKASRNDPRQTPSPEYYLRLANEGILNDINDSSSDNMSSESNLSEDDPFPECEWPEQIDGIVIHQDDGNPDAGEDIRNKLWFTMEQPTKETCAAAFDLFDRYGRLKLDFKNHPVRKGSVIWGSELKDGDLFLIGSLELDEPHSRLGQRSTLVEAMLESFGVILRAKYGLGENVGDETNH